MLQWQQFLALSNGSRTHGHSQLQGLANWNISVLSRSKNVSSRSHLRQNTQNVLGLAATCLGSRLGLSLKGLVYISVRDISLSVYICRSNKQRRRWKLRLSGPFASCCNAVSDKTCYYLHVVRCNMQHVCPSAATPGLPFSRILPGLRPGTFNYRPGTSNSDPAPVICTCNPRPGT